MKKWAAFALVLALVLSLCVPVALAESESLEPYTIDVYLPGATEETMLSDTAIGKVFQQKFNMDFRFIPFVGDWDERCALWLAGGNYPEMLQLDTNDLMKSYIDAEALVSWEPYLADMPNYVSYVGEAALDVLRGFASDGQLYFTHYAMGDLGIGAWPNLVIRSDLLEQQGWPNLFLASEWLEFFRKAKADNPKTEEGLDTIGMCVPFGESWGTSLITIVTGDWQGEGLGFAQGIHDYAVTDIFSLEANREMIGFFNAMYREGLLDPESFTDKGDQIAAKCNTKQALSVWYMNWAASPANEKFREESPQYEYVEMPLIPDCLDGVAYYENSNPAPVGYGMRVVTKNCVHPERVMQAYDYMATEEGFMLDGWGIEGEDYTVSEDGTREVTDELINLRNNDPDGLKARGFHAIGNVFFINVANKYGVVDYATGSEELQVSTYSDRMKEFLEKTGDYKLTRDPWGYGGQTRYTGIETRDWLLEAAMQFDTSDPLYDTFQEIEEWTTGQYPKLIMAETEEAYNALYDEVLARRAEMGMTECVAKANEQVAALKAMYGIE